MKRKWFFAIVAAGGVFVFQNVKAARLEIVPSQGVFKEGDIFNVDIVLDTENQEVVGVDIHYLNFSPKLLQVIDSDSHRSGVQISPGDVFDNTMLNEVDNNLGKISFAQIANPENYFSGKKTIATVSFKVIGAGKASLYFDFSPGQTTDTNVAFNGQDVLSSVGSAWYNLSSTKVPEDTIPPSKVKNFKVVPRNNQFLLSWQNPKESDFFGVRVQRSEKTFPETPFSGVNVYKGSGQSFVDKNVKSGQIYYYSIFAFDSSNNFSERVSQSGLIKKDTFKNNKKLSLVKLKIYTFSRKARIIWQTSEPAISEIRYGSSPKLNEGLIKDNTLTRFHSVEINSLLPSTDYYFQIKLTAVDGETVFSEIKHFITEPDLSRANKNNLNLKNQWGFIFQIIEYLREIILAIFQPNVPSQVQPEFSFDIPSSFRFSRDLALGDKGQEVCYLQQFLAVQDSDIYPEKLVSCVFDTATKRAVIRFQQRYAREVLYPLGLTRGSGRLDRLTREKINQILNNLNYGQK